MIFKFIRNLYVVFDAIENSSISKNLITFRKNYCSSLYSIILWIEIILIITLQRYWKLWSKLSTNSCRERNRIKELNRVEHRNTLKWLKKSKDFDVNIAFLAIKRYIFERATEKTRFWKDLNKISSKIRYKSSKTRQRVCSKLLNKLET